MVNIKGTVDSDLLTGTAMSDVIKGLAGSDTLEGKEGNDFLNGGFGNDNLEGNSGNDFLFGSVGDDNLEGNLGNDFLFGSVGNDSLFGGEDNDFISGGNGNDSLEGNLGNDFLRGGKGNDTINGVGDPFFNSGELGIGTIDTLAGGAGSDRFILNTAIVGIAGIDTFALYNGQGESDFALISDFNPTFDSIELAGQVEQYSLEFLSSGEVSDANLIYQPSASAERDLIAILQDVPSSLDLNDAAFTYVPSFSILDLNSLEN